MTQETINKLNTLESYVENVVLSTASHIESLIAELPTDCKKDIIEQYHCLKKNIGDLGTVIYHAKREIAKQE